MNLFLTQDKQLFHYIQSKKKKIIYHLSLNSQQSLLYLRSFVSDIFHYQCRN